MNFAVADLSQTFDLPICDDADVEGDETLDLALSLPNGATLGTPNTAILTIVDNDAAPTPTPTPTETPTPAPTPAPTPTPPTIGDYSDRMVSLSGNTTATSDANPIGATSINASTGSNFKGVLAVKSNGEVRIINAHPAGTYTVTVKAFNSGGMTAKTFTLMVIGGTECNDTVQFTNAANVGIGNGRSVAIGDFNNDGHQDVAPTLKTVWYQFA